MSGPGLNLPEKYTHESRLKLGTTVLIDVRDYLNPTCRNRIYRVYTCAYFSVDVINATIYSWFTNLILIFGCGICHCP